MNEKGNFIILGRNFDNDHRSALLLFTDPPDGYRSVSLVDMYYLGYYPPGCEPVSFLSRFYLDAPRISMDGMNECGLAIGALAIPEGKGSSDLQKKITICETDVIRLVLDNAKDVEEAIPLLNKYNVVFLGNPLHYLITDAAGNSVVIEFIDGKMEVIHNPEPWQVATNTQITGTKDVALLCIRYLPKKLYERLMVRSAKIAL